MNEKRKKVKRHGSPISGKDLKHGVNEPHDLNNLHPSWRFNLAKTGTRLGEFNFPSGALFQEIVHHLSDFEKKSIKQLRGEDNSLYSVYQADDEHIISEARKYLADFGYDELHKFRLSGRKRVFALRDNDGAFVLLWWDPEHKIYPVEKRHT